MNPLLDTLSQALARAASHPGNPELQFDRVLPQARPDLVGEGVAEVFRSNQTEPFPRLIEGLFERSDSLQQAGLLNQILQVAGPAALAAAGGALTKLLQPGSSQLTAAQASSLRPEQVREIAAAAEQQSPDVVDQLGRFYADHPTLLKTLGSAALVIMMAQMKRRLEKP